LKSTEIILKVENAFPARGRMPRMTKELLWLSDVHADVLGFSLLGHYSRLSRQQPRGVLVTGDISNALRLAEDLTVLTTSFLCPVYITLGNHDYYGGNFQGVQQLVWEACSKHANLFYLDRCAPVWVSSTTALIGCQGWGDGRAGLGKKSTLFVNDRVHIKDFIGRNPDAYFQLLRELGRASAAAFLRVAPGALAKADHLIVGTHVPPFAKSCVFRDRANYLPFYCNMALGRAIQKVARKFSTKRISVYCGHTHHESVYSPLPNVSVHVAKASYDVFYPAGKIPF
jgi:predicted phosphohydrolase